MPPHDASNRNSDLTRLRHYVEKTNTVDSRRDRPGLANCSIKQPMIAAAYEHDDEDDGPITTRWAVG
jgi:hypothetical protein